MNKRMPILLVIGFLGAGKTTFLNWLIQKHPQLHISLILNEFGDAKLESQFITQHDGGTVAELANGCMCCVAKSDIPRVIDVIFSNSPQTQYIFIEASGLSDPDPILEALQSTELEEKISLDSVICIVDGINFQENVSKHPIIMSQIGDADIVLISKVQEAGEEKIAAIKQLLASIDTHIKVFEITDSLDPQLFLHPEIQMDADQPENKQQSLADQEHHHTHEPIQEYWFRSDKEIDRSKFQEVMNHLPPEILRAKGYIFSDNTKYLVQYVSGKLEMKEANKEPTEEDVSTILFLGEQFDQEELNKILLSTTVNTN